MRRYVSVFVLIFVSLFWMASFDSAFGAVVHAPEEVERVVDGSPLEGGTLPLKGSSDAASSSGALDTPMAPGSQSNVSRPTRRAGGANASGGSGGASNAGDTATAKGDKADKGAGGASDSGGMKKGGTGLYAMIAILVLFAGIAGYFFKQSSED